MSDAEQTDSLTFKEFLEFSPPGRARAVTEFAVRSRKDSTKWVIELPLISLYCANEACNGYRYFECKDDFDWRTFSDDWHEIYIDFTCRNCHKFKKRYSLAVRIANDQGLGECFKFGEMPPFGPHTPAKLISLIEPDRELFLQGRRSESLGFGIGCFAYYRRVVENSRDRLIDAIIKTVSYMDPKSELIVTLTNARKEQQFNKSMAMMKDAVPKELLIRGHNPFTLLHRALSKGMHANDDEGCLESGQSIRLVLLELAERMAMIMNENKELDDSIKKLLDTSPPSNV